MPGLIQVPHEDLTSFLADRTDTSIPAVQGSDINDGDLLNATATIEVGNGYKFAITLPSGRVLESAPVGSDYPKRDAIMQWLGAVREAIVNDAAEAGRAARDAQLAEPVAQPSGVGAVPSRTAPAAVPAGTAPADPVDYARSQLRAAIERLAALSVAEADVAKWQRVVTSLTGEGAVKKRRKKRRKKNVVQS